MAYEVTYYCPHCGVVVALEREGYLADKSVTPRPLPGWRYVAPGEAFGDATGVHFVCGESEGCEWREAGCGREFYLNFVRYEAGEEVEPAADPERVELAEGRAPRGPRGPRGPSGPDGPSGGA
jgi:hypothetical protein